MKKFFLSSFLGVLLVPIECRAQTYSFFTLAGSTSSNDGANGTGTNAHFNSPSGVAVDAGGTVYLADTADRTIRKITPGGAVTTLAGILNSPGTNNGATGVARFESPTGLVVNSASSVLVADNGAHNIRLISSSGDTSTFAGAALTPGSMNGTGTGARFTSPFGITVDTSGFFYVGDVGNHAVRKISPAAFVSTLASSLSLPYGVAVDGANNVYESDIGNHTINKITPQGSVSLYAGGAGVQGTNDGSATVARFNQPKGIAVDSSGNVFVADTANHTIRMITPAGVVSTIGGSPGVPGSANGIGSAAFFRFPAGIAVDLSGNLYIADTLNNLIRKGVALPAITAQSTDQTAVFGTNLSLNVTATGGGPLAYQWQQGGQSLANATNATLPLTNMARASAGAYRVAVTNMAGSVTSSNINVRVLVPQQLGTLTVLAEGAAQFAFRDQDGSVADLSYTPNFIVQTSTNLAQWQATAGSFSVSNSFLIFQESTPTNLPARFFRIMEQ